MPPRRAFTYAGHFYQYQEDAEFDAVKVAGFTMLSSGHLPCKALRRFLLKPRLYASEMRYDDAGNIVAKEIVLD